MNAPLAPCPCGQVPLVLTIVEGQGCKYAWVVGACCVEWPIEFHTHYKPTNSPECMAFAIKAWNEAPRAVAKPIREALEAAALALDDWLLVYADAERVEQDRARLCEGGTLAYIAEVRQKIRHALGEVP